MQSIAPRLPPMKKAGPGAARRYRPEGELEKWKKRDPIIIYRERLKQFGVKDDVVSGIETDVRRRVDEATETCKAAPPPPMEILTTDVYADGGWAWRN